MSDWVINDGPEDHCFGCGQQNQSGLRLKFRRTADGSVESEYTAPDSYRGAPGVVHGGIQAVLLDEVMGMTVHLVAEGERTNIVTADFRLRYRKPVPTQVLLTIRGRVDRVEGLNYFLDGEIVDSTGDVLTRAEARFRRID